MQKDYEFIRGKTIDILNRIQESICPTVNKKPWLWQMFRCAAIALGRNKCAHHFNKKAITFIGRQQRTSASARNKHLFHVSCNSAYPEVPRVPV